MGIDSDLIRGHIDTIILKILKDGDRYGYEICKEVEEKTGGEYELKQPTLYSCLKRLEEHKLISSYWKDSDIGGKRHYYKLTNKGIQTLDKNQENWQKSRSIIDSLIYTAPPVINETKQEPIEEITEETQTTEQVNEENNQPPLQIENKDPLQIENEDPLQIEDKEVLLIENEDPLQIENEDPLQIENEDPLQIEDVPTLQIEDKDFENEENGFEETKASKSAYDSFFDDDDDDDEPSETEMLPIDESENTEEELDFEEEEQKTEESATDIESIFADIEETSDIEETIEDSVLEDNISPADIHNSDDNQSNNIEEIDDEEPDFIANSLLSIDDDDQVLTCKTLYAGTDDLNTEIKDEQEQNTIISEEFDENNSLVQSDLLGDTKEKSISEIVDEIVEDTDSLQQVTNTSYENQEIETDLNKDEEEFDIKQYLNKSKSFFNAGASDTPSVHNYMKGVKELQEAQEDEMFLEDAIEAENIEEDFGGGYLNDEDHGPDYSAEKERLMQFGEKAYDTDESDIRYENVLEETSNSPSQFNSVHNVDFQDEDDKNFTDEIMLSFSDQNPVFNSEPAYTNAYSSNAFENFEKESIEKSRNLSQRLNDDVAYAHDNAKLISADSANQVVEDNLNNEDFVAENNFNFEIATVNHEEEKIDADTNLTAVRDLTELKSQMSKVGITVKPFYKNERKINDSKDYLLTNKIKFVRSLISSCLMAFLLAFSYIVLTKYNLFEFESRTTTLFYCSAIGLFTFITLVYGILFWRNPYKKGQPKYAFRLSMLFGLLFFLQSLVIIFATNIMLGFVSFSQVDYNHIKWIVPCIASLWFLICPVVHHFLFTAKKCHT